MKYTTEEMHHVCDNCGEAFDAEDLKPVQDMALRVDPGGIVPSGECPDCGTLAYPKDAELTTLMSQHLLGNMQERVLAMTEAEYQRDDSGDDLEELALDISALVMRFNGVEDHNSGRVGIYYALALRVSDRIDWLAIAEDYFQQVKAVNMRGALYGDR